MAHIIRDCVREHGAPLTSESTIAPSNRNTLTDLIWPTKAFCHYHWPAFFSCVCACMWRHWWHKSQQLDRSMHVRRPKKEKENSMTFYCYTSKRLYFTIAIACETVPSPKFAPTFVIDCFFLRVFAILNVNTWPSLLVVVGFHFFTLLFHEKVFCFFSSSKSNEIGAESKSIVIFFDCKFFFRK